MTNEGRTLRVRQAVASSDRNVTSRRLVTKSTARVALLIAVALLLPACAPSGLNAACDAIRVFQRSVGSAQTYTDLSQHTARLADDLSIASQNASNAALRADLRFAAGAARDVTTVIRNRQSRDVVDAEIDALAYALDQVRYRC